MKNVIVGNGIHATLVKGYIEELGNIKIDAFVVEKGFIDKPLLEGCPVVSLEDLIDNYPKDNCKLYMGIGYKHMGYIREKLFKILKKEGY